MRRGRSEAYRKIRRLRRQLRRATLPESTWRWHGGFGRGEIERLPTVDDQTQLHIALRGFDAAGQGEAADRLVAIEAHCPFALLEQAQLAGVVELVALDRAFGRQAQRPGAQA